MIPFAAVICRIAIVLLLGLPLVSRGDDGGQPPRWAERVAFWAAADVAGMRREMQTIDRQLAKLPAVAGINSGNRIGYQSAGIPPGTDPWIEIELPAPTLLDRVVLVHGGRIYLTKDALVSRETFEQGYPHIEAFRALRRDLGLTLKFSSLQSERLDL